MTEFLPVSSLGHLCILEQYMGIGHETGLLSETMLHLGSAAAIIFLFRKDLKKIGLGLLGMFMDMIGNLNLYIHNKKTGESLGYARIVTGTYRKTGALLVISIDSNSTSGSLQENGWLFWPRTLRLFRESDFYLQAYFFW